MNIYVVAVGKVREKYLKTGIEEYSKRLSRYCNMNIIGVDDEKAPENLSEKEQFAVKAREGERILKRIPAGSFFVALDVKGQQLSSEELAGKIQDLMVRGTSQITFVIGGSLGLSDEVLMQSDFRLSFSKMTFPHQLMQLILLEQIYRGFKIIHGETYHK